MFELGCQDTDWVGGNDRGFIFNFSPEWPHISHLEPGQREMWLSWVHFWLVWGPEEGP